MLVPQYIFTHFSGQGFCCFSGVQELALALFKKYRLRSWAFRAQQRSKTSATRSNKRRGQNFEPLRFHRFSYPRSSFVLDKPISFFIFKSYDLKQRIQETVRRMGLERRLDEDLYA
jgi:hypothetical protein